MTGRTGTLSLGRAVLAVVVAGSCASNDLGRAGSAEVIAAALRRSTAVPARPVNQSGRPLAYLALGGKGGARLAAFDLAQSKMMWTVAARMTGRVVAGVSIVVHADGDTLVARDAGTGGERWRSAMPAGGTLVGYAMDGDTVYFVSRRGNQLRGGHGEIAALAGRSGGVLWRRPLGTGHVGGPAARGGIVAVPNRSQFVSLLDGRNGDPLGSVLSKEQAANFVEALPEGLFYGYASDGAYLVSAETATGVRSSPGYLHAKFPPFVRPVYHFDMYRPELTDYSAIDRNRVLWRADVDGPRASFRAGTVCVLNYRFFFGFDAASGALRWGYNNPLVEAASAAHTGAAIVFATADGEMGALDPGTGRRTYKVRLPGEVISGATFDAEGYAPGGSGAGADMAGGAGGAPALARVLSSIASDPDRRFSEVQMFAVDQLARIPGREVTADLLKMLGNEGMSPEVVKRAGRALVDRKDETAVDLFVDAIRVHTDYADSAQSAHLEVLARAVGAVRAREAAGPLAEHLRVPETEPAAVLEIARALAAIGGKRPGAGPGTGPGPGPGAGLDEATLSALRDYLTVYRADPAYAGDPAALLAVTDALVQLGGPPERELVLYVAEEPKTLPPLREYARRALVQSAEAVRAAGAGGGGGGGAGTTGP